MSAAVVRGGYVLLAEDASGGGCVGGLAGGGGCVAGGGLGGGAPGQVAPLGHVADAFPSFPPTGVASGHPPR